MSGISENNFSRTVLLHFCLNQILPKDIINIITEYSKEKPIRYFHIPPNNGYNKYPLFSGCYSFPITPTEHQPTGKCNFSEHFLKPWKD